MTPETLEEIRGRWKAARPAPWRWSGYRSAHQVDLMGPGGDEVMGFRRWGMKMAQPVFCSKGLLHGVAELTEGCDPGAPGRARITEIPHPDAVAIAAAPADVSALLAEVDRLRERLALAEAVVTAARGEGKTHHEAWDALHAALRVLDAAKGAP